MLLAVENNPESEHSGLKKSSVRSPEILFNMSEVADTTNGDQNEINAEIEKKNGTLELNAANKNPIESMEDNLFNFNDKTVEKLSCDDSHIVNGAFDSDEKDDNLELEINNMINNLSKNEDNSDICTTKDGRESLSDNETEVDVPMDTISENAQTKTDDSLGVSTDALGVPLDALSIPPDDLSVPPDALSVTPDALSVTPDALSVAPDAISDPAEALCVPPDAISVPAEALSAPPDALSVPSDSSSAPYVFDDVTSKLNECVVENIINNITKTLQGEENLETSVDDIFCEKEIKTEDDLCEKDTEPDYSDCNVEINSVPLPICKVEEKALLPPILPDIPIKLELNKSLTDIDVTENSEESENNIDAHEKTVEPTSSESVNDEDMNNLNIKPEAETETEAGEFSVSSLNGNLKESSEEKMAVDSSFDNISDVIEEIKMEVDPKSPILATDHMVYIASPDAFVQNDNLSDTAIELNSHTKNDSEAMDCDISVENKSIEDNIRLSTEKVTEDLLADMKDVDSAKDTSNYVNTLDLLLSDDEMDASKIRQPSKSSLAEGTSDKTTASVSLNYDEDLLLVLNKQDEEIIKKSSAGDSRNEKIKVGEPVIENDRSQIILDDDDDILLSKSSTNDVSKNVSEEKDPEKTAFDQLFLNDNELPKENSSTENNSLSKDSQNDLAMDVNVPSSDATPEKEATIEPIIPLNFMKTFKSSLGRMTRDDLEEYCLVKIVEAIVKRSNLSEAETKLKSQMNNIDALRKKLAHITKQNRDLEIVMKNLCSEHKRRKEELIEPVKISRSVGFQVGPSSVKNKAPVKPAAVPSSSSVNPKPAKAARARQTNSNSPTIPPNAENSPNSQKKIPISNSQRQTEEDKSKTAKTNPSNPILKSALSMSNQNVNNNSAQKQIAEKRISDSSIDLTDDEPPTKQMTLNNRTKAVTHPNKMSTIPSSPNNGNGNKLYMMNQHIQTFPNMQKPIFRPRSAISNQAIPIPNLRPHNVVQSQPRLGIPIKTVGPNAPIPQHRGIQPTYLSSVYPKHPAPLPVSRSFVQSALKFLPPKPELKISKVSNGIVISWVMETGSDYRFDDIASYQIYAYQETSALPHTDLWKKIGDVKALPLPMACTLTQFMAGYKYYFAVRAVDVKTRVGPFSLPGHILLNNDK
ncbi:fibronectin-III type domain-containing protein windei isoform X2 [Arctopsyche grandis]